MGLDSFNNIAGAEYGCQFGDSPITALRLTHNLPTGDDLFAWNRPLSLWPLRRTARLPSKREVRAENCLGVRCLQLLGGSLKPLVMPVRWDKGHEPM